MNDEQKQKMQNARAARKGQPRKSVVHTVRTADRGSVQIAHYTLRKAVACMCTECMGFEDSPVDCTSPMCPLYPYRRKTRMNARGDK
jgi:hypothetical protein